LSNSKEIKITPFELTTEAGAIKLMTSLGVTSQGIKILAAKSIFCAFLIKGIKSWEANIIKQHLLSLGSDAAIERDALVKDINTDILIFGSRSQLKRLSNKLKGQPFSLKEVSRLISLYLENLEKKEFVFLARKKTLKIRKPIVCGIINLTKDSFSGDGLLAKATSSSEKIKFLALKKAEQMIKEGAKILDIGAESSRPFAKQLRVKEELAQLIPVIKAIRKEFKKIPLSVDTYKYPVAYEASCLGIDIINDITALRHNPKIADIIKKNSLGCILMHMKGSPLTMQLNPYHKDVVWEIISFFKDRINFLNKKGISQNQICLDPGIGFGKRLEDNTRIINELYKLKIFGLPIFLGLSRKSFIGKILKNNIDQRLAGTIAANVVSINKGANILRVHDVKETVEAIKIASSINLN
tara:strand:- start:4071 stop:5306 length:1236 start_codon:yes stop_codon:yes gene_type:complete